MCAEFVRQRTWNPAQDAQGWKIEAERLATQNSELRAERENTRVLQVDPLSVHLCHYLKGA